MPSPPTAASRAVAPWRALFLQHISEMDQATFVLSSVHQPASSSSSSSSSSPTPRARTCVFRGMWATLPENKLNPARRNPPLFESDLPVFTTDVRMDKFAEFCPESDPCGGGPVEAVWWVPEAKTQWRVRGAVWVLGHGGVAGPDGEEGRSARETVGPRMRRLGSGGGGGGGASGEGCWSWAMEVTGHFGNVSPAMRGTFRNPAPGTPRATTAPGPGEGLGQKVEDLEDELARRNFRVCVIVPEEVDQVLLTQDPRRWLYKFVGGRKDAGGGEVAAEEEWETVELWP